MEAGLVPHRFKGIDAKKGEHENYFHKVTSTCKTSCPNGLVGCGLSHILLAEQLFYDGKQIALILEDDSEPVNPETLLDDIQETLASVPNDWDIIKLHCDMCLDGTNSHKINGGSFASYLISQSGMEKMSKLKLDWHIDLQVANENFKIYKSKNNLFKADESSSEHSERGVITPIGWILGFPRRFFSGEKSVDDMMSYKVFKIQNFEFSGLHLILFFLITLILVRIR
jgi:GR25 family glycosyltransferase involved in LPS biosynthesis